MVRALPTQKETSFALGLPAWSLRSIPSNVAFKALVISACTMFACVQQCTLGQTWPMLLWPGAPESAGFSLFERQKLDLTGLEGEITFLVSGTMSTIHKECLFRNIDYWHWTMELVRWQTPPQWQTSQGHYYSPQPANCVNKRTPPPLKTPSWLVKRSCFQSRSDVCMRSMYAHDLQSSRHIHVPFARGKQKELTTDYQFYTTPMRWR